MAYGSGDIIDELHDALRDRQMLLKQIVDRLAGVSTPEEVENVRRWLIGEIFDRLNDYDLRRYIKELAAQEEVSHASRAT